MKKQIVFLILFVALFTVAPAQNIPDWTKTSSTGSPYTFHDVLSNGNAVVLIFFATWAPPCQSAFTQLQTIWDDYGNGNCNVYVFGMDVDNGETNAQINTFLTTYGATFPAFATCQADFSYYDANFSPNPGYIPLTLVIIPNIGNPINSTVVWSKVGWGTGLEITEINTALSNNGFNPCGNMTISISNIDSAICYGYCDGSATVLPNGGTPPYTYQWDDPNNQTTATATGLCVGTYSVTVTDSGPFSVVTNVIIEQPDSLTSNTNVINQVNPPNCDGEVAVVASGGTPPYSFLWDDPLNQTTSTATGLCLGAYHVTVTDFNNCPSLVDTVELLDFTGIKQQSNNNGVAIYPNPTSGKFTVANATGEIAVYDLFGRKVLATRETEVDMSGFSKGIYLIRVGEAVRKLMLQ